MTRKTLAILLALLLLLALAGCGAAPAQPGQTESPAPGNSENSAAESVYAIDRITVGTTTAIETATRGEYNYDMLSSAVTELPLVYQDLSGAYHPLLASYATEDAQTWTYTIVDGMYWDDGVPVTAEDILFTLQYDEAEGSAVFQPQTDADGKTVEPKYSGYSLSEDGRSISLTLTTPNVRELSNMTSFRVMPAHIYEGKDSVTDAEARIGCGPYAFTAFNKEAGTITFTAKQDYPETPHVKTIVYQMFGNEDTMYMALDNGDIDMTWNYSAGVPATYADILSVSDSVKTESVPAVNEPAVLAFNNSRGFFADENLRSAVSWALDYEMFKTYFGSPYAETPNRGFVPTTTVGYAETEKLSTDTGKAEKLMAAAGYTRRNDAGFFVDAAGAEAGFTLTFNADKTVHAGCAELIKTQLEQFGIRVTLDGVDKDSYNAKTSNKFSEGNVTMEAALYGYTAAGMGMLNGLGTIYVDGAHAVQGGCQVFDREFSAIRDELAGAKTVEEYYAAAAKMQQYYAAHTPLLALYWDNLMYAYGAGYDNVTVDCVFGLNNVNNWFSITKN